MTGWRNWSNPPKSHPQRNSPQTRPSSKLSSVSSASPPLLPLPAQILQPLDLRNPQTKKQTPSSSGSHRSGRSLMTMRSSRRAGRLMTGFGAPLLLVSGPSLSHLGLSLSRNSDSCSSGKPDTDHGRSIGLLKKRKKAKTSPEPAVADKGKGKAAAVEVQKKDKVEAGPAAVAATA
jgi:hypothetical protein